MALYLLIHKSNLLEYLENNLWNIIVFFHNIKSFVLFLISILPLNPFYLKDIKCDFSHSDGAELGRVWISCLPDVAILVPGVVVLALDYLFLMLIELVVEVEEINGCHIHLVHVLGHGISRCYTNVTLQLKTGITLGLDASVERASRAVVDGKLTINDNVLDVDETTLKIVEHARVVRVGQIINCSVDSKTLEPLIVNTQYPPSLLVFEHEDTHAVEIRLVAEGCA